MQVDGRDAVNLLISSLLRVGSLSLVRESSLGSWPSAVVTYGEWR